MSVSEESLRGSQLMLDSSCSPWSSSLLQEGGTYHRFNHYAYLDISWSWHVIFGWILVMLHSS